MEPRCAWSTTTREYWREASVVSSEVLRIEAIPEAGSLVRGIANKVYVFVGYPDGYAADDVEVDEPGQCPMPDIFELAPQDMAWLHR